MQKNPVPPVIDLNVVTNEDIIWMITSAHNAVCHLMANGVDKHHYQATYISMIQYLNDIEALDKKIRGESDKPVWHQKYNLLCLLNAESDMELYGPPRRRWEGNITGEKSICPIKDHFHGFVSNCQMHLHNNYMQSQTIQRILVDNGNEVVDDGDSKMPHRTYRHGYNVRSTIIEKIETDQPILLVRLIDTRFGIIFSGVKFLLLTDSEFKYVVTSCHSRLFSLNVNFESFKSAENVSISDIEHDCVAIPIYLNSSKTNSRTGIKSSLSKVFGETSYAKLYVIYTSQWLELNQDKNFVYSYL